MKKILLLTIAMLMTVANAYAFVITAQDIYDGSQSLGTISSSDDLMLKGRTDAWSNYFEGVGTVGGVQGEFDSGFGTGDYLLIDFGQAVSIDWIDLGVLYPAGENTDMVNEVAVIEFGKGQYYTLTATGATTATYSGPGSVLNLSPAQDGVGEDGRGFAAWQILNPFGDEQVSYLKFYAQPVGDYEGSENSDFNVISFSGQPVPEPASLALLGLGVLGVFARRRSVK